MFTFFNGIASFIDTIVKFVINLIQTLIELVMLVVRGFGFLTATIAYCPPFVLSFLLAIITFVVLLQVLNKGS